LSDQPSIVANEVGKQYLIRHQVAKGQVAAYRSIRESVSEWLKRRRDANAASKEQFWALQNISFEIHPGECIGVIGRNGAGKSTLLKLLSRITQPTIGQIKLRGRVASLLEVGTGFHPELTGRENIFLNGAILGMPRSEIRKKFDEIVDFAEVEKFLDTPVKRYSSGMYVRLAFAVAAHLDPDILIVDEVLAVGDSEFQKKCLKKMEDATTESSRTVLFVSHNMHSIASLTSRAMLLEHGQMKMFDSTEKTIRAYLGSETSGSTTYEAPEQKRGTPHVRKAEVHTSDPAGVHIMTRPLKISFELEIPEPIRKACFSFQILDENQRPIVHSWLYDSEQPFGREARNCTITCMMDRSRLFIGDYSLNIYFAESPGGAKFENLVGICAFTVESFGIERSEYSWNRGESVYLEDFTWTIEQS
jgi:ABC-type polysaccharide/polyol phosphate transport system ATPase subunit